MPSLAEVVDEYYAEMYLTLPEFFLSNNEEGTFDEPYTPDPRVAEGISSGLRAAEIKRWLAVALNIHAKSPICTYYLAAHLITLADAGIVLDEEAGTVIVESDLQIERMRVDDMEVEYHEPQESTSSSGGDEDGEGLFATQTIYGRLFITLEHRKLGPSMRMM